MAATFLIPTVLRTHTGNRESVTIEGKTVGEALESLVKAHPGLKPHIMTEAGIFCFKGRSRCRHLDLLSNLADLENDVESPGLAGKI